MGDLCTRQHRSSQCESLLRQPVLNDADADTQVPRHKRFASRYSDPPWLPEPSQKSKAMRRREVFFGFGLPMTNRGNLHPSSIHIRQGDDCYNSLIESGSTEPELMPLPFLDNKSVDCLSMQSSLASVETTPSISELPPSSPGPEISQQEDVQQDADAETKSIASSLDESDFDYGFECSTAVSQIVGRCRRAKLVSVSPGEQRCTLKRQSLKHRRHVSIYDAPISDATRSPRASSRFSTSPLTPRFSRSLRSYECGRTSKQNRPLPLSPARSVLTPPVTPTDNMGEDLKQRHHLSTTSLWNYTDERADASPLSPAASSPTIDRAERSLAEQSSSAKYLKLERRSSGLRSFFTRKSTKDSEQPRHRFDGSASMFSFHSKSLSRKFSSNRTDTNQDENEHVPVPNTPGIRPGWTDPQQHTASGDITFSTILTRTDSFETFVETPTSVTLFSQVSSTDLPSHDTTKHTSSSCSNAIGASVQEDRHRSQNLADILMRSRSVQFFRSRERV
ncbi:hypothetical protein AAP_04154 [Ascosphaera apis ARSEF 7405]|uniref:Uncharacterized protein n=1 Tax=Ascosphaera apis ARSEF 7405 TaxID=392613 RepID=A0A162I7W1_9EURO|nr:hypothetical protein AAP_04154 [Ascosphaera apis ARSEF 7405]